MMKIQMNNPMQLQLHRIKISYGYMDCPKGGRDRSQRVVKYHYIAKMIAGVKKSLFFIRRQLCMKRLESHLLQVIVGYIAHGLSTGVPVNMCILKMQKILHF